jgi:hypothetical protein
LFIDADQGTGGKWGLWIIHKLVLTGVYGLIVFMHHSRWRDRLPGNWLLFLYVSKFFCLVFNDHNLMVALLQQDKGITLHMNELVYAACHGTTSWCVRPPVVAAWRWI